MTKLASELIDIGVNLTGKSFKKDVPQVIERAIASGVSHMVVTGTNLQHSEEAIHLCEKWPESLLCTAGLHPHHAKEWNGKAAQKIEQLAKNTAVRAIGECGLDYNRNFSTPKDQRYAFEAQLELAGELALPVFLHQRDAHKDFAQIMDRWRHKLPGGVVHCFTGTPDEARASLDMDLHIGITGWLCDERRGKSLQQAVAVIPAERLMIETDAPYLMPRDLPQTLSGQIKAGRNEPMVLSHICAALAKYKNIDAAEMAVQTTQLARQFFAIKN
ncbi:Deoxyribonuclease TatD [hydrothermal vent metagenome]|uniref:Deoxyribonuclease TatD n=1 Tax=hydrothermal vent metagenome TaxID=652676 RepID=A0A3B0XNA1_9ZZZZ